MITRMWADGPTHLQHQDATMVRLNFMLDGDERVHSIPAVWTGNDLHRGTPRQTADMMGQIMVNLINSAGDYAEQTMVDVRRGHMPVPDYDLYPTDQDTRDRWPENEDNG